MSNKKVPQAVLKSVICECACNECGQDYYPGEKAACLKDTDGSLLWYCNDCVPDQTFTMGTTPEYVIEASFARRYPNEGEGYFMGLNNSDFKLFKRMVNIGIDSKLESIKNVGQQVGHKWEVTLDSADLLVLLRRLCESGKDKAWQLRSDILSGLQIEEI